MRMPEGPKALLLLLALAWSCHAETQQHIAHGTKRTAAGRGGQRARTHARALQQNVTTTLQGLKVSGTVSCTLRLYPNTKFNGAPYTYTSYEWQEGSPGQCDDASFGPGSKMNNAAESVFFQCLCSAFDDSGVCWPTAKTARLVLTDPDGSDSPGDLNYPKSISVEFNPDLCNDLGCSWGSDDLSQVPVIEGGDTKFINMASRIGSFQVCLGTPSAIPPPIQYLTLPPSPPPGAPSAPPRKASPPSPYRPRSPPPRAPPPPSTKSQDFTGGACSDPAGTLAAINANRALHNGNGVQWKPSLAKTAQAWAAELATQQFCILSPSPANKAGNVGEATFTWVQQLKSRPGCKAAVAEMYKNGLDAYAWTTTPYQSNVPKLQIVRGFVEMVWRSTTLVGCGFAAGSNTEGDVCYVSVCQYSPGLTKVDADWLQNVKARTSGVRRALQRAWW